MVRRAGARAGDAVMVTGTIGDAVAGLHLGRAEAARAGLSPAAAAFLEDRYRVPRPRVGLAAMLRRHASAAIDISDGLAGDLAKLCAASAVGADIAVESIPLSDAAAELLARDRGIAFADLVTGGDDYEIAFTLAPADIAACMEAGRGAGIAITRIGMIVAGSGGPRFLDASGEEVRFASLSFSHF
jgi:thiamine-monophosphate kinase